MKDYSKYLLGHSHVQAYQAQPPVFFCKECVFEYGDSEVIPLESRMCINCKSVGCMIQIEEAKPATKKYIR